MKCALAAVGFINENITYNKKVITDTMIKYAGEADIILFGEAFLQGFYGPSLIRSRMKPWLLLTTIR